jgi:nucleoside-diphosphate-sugar epimerase
MVALVRNPEEGFLLTVMITGGTGFLGSHLARHLLEQAGETDVVLFDAAPNPDLIGDIAERVTVVQGDVLEPTDLLSAMRRYNVNRIAHLAFVLTRGAVAHPYRAIKINTMGTANIFETSRIHGVERVVYASSAAVYGTRSTLDDDELDEEVVPNPDTIYGAAKLFNEQMADLYGKEHGLDLIGLRPVSIFGVGRGGRITSDAQHFMVRPELAALGRPIEMPPDDQVSDWMYVADAAAAWRLALAVKEPPHRIFNISSEHRRIGDATRHVRSLLPDAEIAVSTDPVTMLRSVSNRRLREGLGFEPRYTLEQGLEEYLSAVRLQAGLPPLAPPP